VISAGPERTRWLRRLASKDGGCAPHNGIRIEEFDPVGGAPELEQNHTPPVKLEQIHPVARGQRIEPHGKTSETASAFLIRLLL
jgi:hypothetical protein